jgi:cobalamin biosynthesis protein CobT
MDFTRKWSLNRHIENSCLGRPSKPEIEIIDTTTTTTTTTHKRTIKLKNIENKDKIMDSAIKSFPQNINIDMWKNIIRDKKLEQQKKDEEIQKRYDKYSKSIKKEDKNSSSDENENEDKNSSSDENENENENEDKNSSEDENENENENKDKDENENENENKDKDEDKDEDEQKSKKMSITERRLIRLENKIKNLTPMTINQTFNQTVNNTTINTFDVI